MTVKHKLAKRKNKRSILGLKIPPSVLNGWLVYFVTNIRYAARLSVYTVT